MKITVEQYKQLGKLVLDDFPIKDIDDNLGTFIFNSLPSNIQGDVVSWGFSDTPTRESIFCFLLDKIGFNSTEEYYKSEVAKEFFQNGAQIDLENFKQRIVKWTLL